MRTLVSSSPSSLSNCTSSSAATTSPASTSSFCTSCSRCKGLDLLAMAALEVGGANRGVGGNTHKGHNEDNSNKKLVMVVKGEEGVEGGELGPRPTRRRQMVTPSRFRDSILQPWKRQSRRRQLAPRAKCLG